MCFESLVTIIDQVFTFRAENWNFVPGITVKNDRERKNGKDYFGGDSVIVL